MKSNALLTQCSASASFPFSADFLPLAIEFTEKASRGFAFGEREIGGIVLAVEEIFAFYLNQLKGLAGIDLRLENESYQLLLTLTFRMANPELRAFNLTYRIDPDNEASMTGLGLMIAARSVTRLSFDFGNGEQFSLRLARERTYAPVTPIALPGLHTNAALRLYEPTGEDIRYFGSLLASCAPAFVPSFLQRPDMAVDMLACGAIGALLANSGETIGGGVFWRRLSKSTIELFGPYVLYADPDDNILTRLIDEAMGRISRSGARTLLRRQGPLAGFERFFDRLGELTLIAPSPTASDGNDLTWTHYYKQLREESGGTVYSEAPFSGFLRSEYKRLCLPRQIRETSFQGEGRRRARSAASVLSVDFEHRRSLATLRLLVMGCDLADNLAAHLALLQYENIANVIVEIDTGHNDDTAFAPILYAAGFLPLLLVPDAGAGDLVLFAR